MSSTGPPAIGTGRPPELSSTALVKLVHHLFSFHSIDQQSFKQLDSYDDRNFYFVASREDGCPLGYVFKMYNCLNNVPEVVKAVSALMKHLHRRGFQGVDQIVSRAGDSIAQISERELGRVTGENCEGTRAFTYCVRVVRFVSGQTLDSLEKEYVTPKLLFEVGQYLGRIDAALSDEFSDEVISNRVLANFDLMHFQTMYRNFLPTVNEPHRERMARAVFAGYKTHVVPKFSSFRRGVVYNDAHTSNIIVRSVEREFRVAAFIDFDDAVHSYCVFELAILLADFLAENIHPDNQPIRLVTPLISGYCQEFPLREDEFSSLYYLVMARCCQLAMVTGEQYKREPWNEYLLLSLDPPWRVVELLLRTDQQEVNRIWTNAIGKNVSNYV